MERGVIYFNLGTKHLVRLAVSVWNLRKHYDGPIAIISAGGDEGLLQRFTDDSRLNVQIVPVGAVMLRRNTAYVAKASLWRFTPFVRTLFLDADTVPIKNPMDMLDQYSEPWVLTRFSEWVTTGGIYSGRIKQWCNVRCEGVGVREMVDRALQEPWPAINTGVFAFDLMGAIPSLEVWERLTVAGARCSFTDEYAAQILITILPESVYRVVDDRWNASALFAAAKPEDVVTWHCHGGKHAKREEGQRIWLPFYREAMGENVAGVSEWSPAGDKWLERLLHSR